MNETLEKINQLREHLRRRIVGQEALVDSLIVALLADGHLLLEGAPGLAKTRAVRELATGIEADYHRIQFTPDLLPGDVTGTEIYKPQEARFEFQSGPVFHNIVLADEINRAPAKVQAALLEAMAERQVSVGSKTYQLPGLFMVLATQNPIEQEGTYPLPEAQLDRFLMKILVDYPDTTSEKAILRLVRRELMQTPPEDSGASEHAKFDSITEAAVFDARKQVMAIHVSEAVEEYIVQLVAATRNPGAYGGELATLIEFGASPRASLALERTARVLAWLSGRDYLLPEDIQSVAADVLRHRIAISFEAEAEGLTPDSIIRKLLQTVPVV